MNAEQVVEKILSEARAEAEKITAAAAEKCDQAQTQLNSRLADYHSRTRVLAEQAAEDKRKRILATAKMELRKEYLAAKVALLADVFEQARQGIRSLPDKEYLKLITALMSEAVQTGDEEVVIGRDEKRIDHALIKEINRTLAPGFKGNLCLAKDRADIDAGFILRRGKIRVNVSTDVLIAAARDQLEITLAEELFAQQTDSHSD